MSRALTQDETLDWIDEKPAWSCPACGWESDDEPADGACPKCGNDALDFAAEGAC